MRYADVQSLPTFTHASDITDDFRLSPAMVKAITGARWQEEGGYLFAGGQTTRRALRERGLAGSYYALSDLGVAVGDQLVRLDPETDATSLRERAEARTREQREARTAHMAERSAERKATRDAADYLSAHPAANKALSVEKLRLLRERAESASDTPYVPITLSELAAVVRAVERR